MVSIFKQSNHKPQENSQILKTLCKTGSFDDLSLQPTLVELVLR